MKYIAALLVGIVTAQDMDWEKMDDQCNRDDCLACEQIGRRCGEDGYHQRCDRGDCWSCDQVGRPCGAATTTDECCEHGCGDVCRKGMNHGDMKGGMPCDYRREGAG